MSQKTLSMMGTVASVDAAGPMLEFARASSCGGCKMKSSCGSHLFESRIGAQLRVSQSIRCGQQARISLPAGLFLMHVAVAYLLIPLLALLGAASASQVGTGDLVALVGAAVGGWLGYSLLRLYDSHRVERPEAVLVVNDSAEQSGA